MVLGLGLGCVVAMLINWSIMRQLATMHSEPWWMVVPIVGAGLRRDWVALAADVAMLVVSGAFWHTYGWSLRFVLMLSAAAVLIHTAAVDWRVRLIDTLVMAGATAVALACAPWLAGGWINALLGMLAAAIVFMLLFAVARVLYPQQHAPFGLGDVYLGMFIGALVGFTDVGAALFGGMLLAGVASAGLLTVYGYKQARHMPIAYGAFLCMGVLLHLVLR